MAQQRIGKTEHNLQTKKKKNCKSSIYSLSSNLTIRNNFGKHFFCSLENEENLTKKTTGTNLYLATKWQKKGNPGQKKLVTK